MASKAKLKRRNKRLKKEFKVMYDDYQSIGRESIDATILLNDIVKLLAEYDNNYDGNGDWFMRAFRAADIERIEKLKAEIKELKAPKVTMVTMIDGNGEILERIK